MGSVVNGIGAGSFSPSALAAAEGVWRSTLIVGDKLV